MRLGMFAGIASIMSMGLAVSRPGDDIIDREDEMIRQAKAAHRSTYDGRNKGRYNPRRVKGSPLRDHKQERAIARRLRQKEQIAANQAAQLARSIYGRNGHSEFAGMTRRGRLIKKEVAL